MTSLSASHVMDSPFSKREATKEIRLWVSKVLSSFRERIAALKGFSHGFIVCGGEKQAFGTKFRYFTCFTVTSTGGFWISAAGMRKRKREEKRRRGLIRNSDNWVRREAQNEGREKSQLSSLPPEKD